MFAGAPDSPRLQALGNALPIVFGLAVLVGMLLTVSTLVGTSAVDIGSFRSESHDGLSIALGHGLYHDPAGVGYTGLLYTPLEPLLIAGLDELGRWNGWPVLITVLATAALAVMIGRVALRAAGGSVRRTPSVWAGAIGIGGFAVWMANTAVGLLYLGWTDELAWALALGGLLAGSRTRDPRRAAVAVLLLTLAIWAKQTAAVAALAYALWLALLALRGKLSPRFAALTITALVLANLAVLELFALATGGWEFFFNFTLPTRETRIYGAGTSATDLAKVVAPPALCCLALGAAALGRGFRERLTLDSPAMLLALFTLIGIPAAMYFRSKQGGNPNQYLGVIWALGALAALAWGNSRTNGRQRPVDALIVLAVLLAAGATAGRAARYDLRLLRVRFSLPVPAELRALGREGGIFQPNYSDLTPGQVYPDAFNIGDLLAADEQPMSVVEALLHRRFRYAETYLTALGPAGYAFFNTYGSAYGAYEAGYLWKLDQLIEAGYGAAPGLPSGVLERRPGPNHAAQLAACFGPFQLAAQRWTIRRGGGLWCRSAHGLILLAGAPAGFSELITTAPVTVHGSLILAARPGATVLVAGIEARRVRSGWSVGSRTGRLLAPGATLTLALRVSTPARLSILATPYRGVTFDLRGLRLGP